MKKPPSSERRPGRARPTQLDIARALGVTQATVSLALGNHPRISSHVREHVRAMAERLGYEPDPYLTGLSAHKKQRRQAGFHATLAWITNWPKGGRDWRKISTYVHYHDGAAIRAAELGYRLEHHDLAEPGMTPRRLEQILRAKNIPGLLIAPQPHSGATLDLRLDRFSVVTFGYSLASPRLHMVTNHHFRSTEAIFHTLLSRGYRRPGLVVDEDNDLRSGCIPSSAFLHAQQSLPRERRVPALIERELTPDRFLRWYRRYKPDAIVALWDVVYPWLIDAGVRVPEETALALRSVREPDGRFAGMWENPRLIGARAVELLIDLVHRGERGVPEIPSCLMIEGTWVDGRTVRPRASPAELYG